MTSRFDSGSRFERNSVQLVARESSVRVCVLLAACLLSFCQALEEQRIATVEAHARYEELDRFVPRRVELPSADDSSLTPEAARQLLHHKLRRAGAGEQWQEPTHDPVIHYQFRAVNTTFRLLLWQQDELHAHIGDGGEQRNNVNGNCHYVGIATSHPGSTATLSTCGGALQGRMRTATGDFLLEASADHVGAEPVHRLLRRSAAPRLGGQERAEQRQQSERFCGVPDTVPLREGTQQQEDQQRERRAAESQFGDLDSQRHCAKILVVVDQEMMQRHVKSLPRNSGGRDGTMSDMQRTLDVTGTIMNVVKGLFHDKSLGSTVDFHVMNIVITNSSGPHRLHLSSSMSAFTMLDTFCGWQDSLPMRVRRGADHAVLLTGLDLCSMEADNRRRTDRKCNILGMAGRETWCDRSDSCSIAEYNGLASAFTVAHEIGHGLAMNHDDEASRCSDNRGIMAPSATASTDFFRWSQCSAAHLRTFLRIKRHLPKFCMLNCPRRSPEQHDILPGRDFNVDEQCQMLRGNTSRFCRVPSRRALKQVCKQLLCQHGVRGTACKGSYTPAADGTPCDRRNPKKQCFRGECKVMELPEVDGNWSSWGTWTRCSRTCGAGVSVRRRTCTNPRPRNGGSSCPASDKDEEAVICNRMPCPLHSIDFREHQCKPAKMALFPPNRGACDLVCSGDPTEREDQRDDVRYVGEVEDGTPCNHSLGQDICIAGQCVAIGCDQQLSSTRRFDRCMVCGGNGTSCTAVSGGAHINMKKSQSRYKNIQNHVYESLQMLPIGTVNVIFKETSSPKDDDFVLEAVSNRTHAELIALHQRPPRHSCRWFHGAGTRMSLCVDGAGRQTLHIVGPLREPVMLKIRMPKKLRKRISVTYVFHGASVVLECRERYFWKDEEPGPCSKQCGQGLQVVSTHCVQDCGAWSKPVKSSKCFPQPRPNVTFKLCNTHPCKPRWTALRQMPCNATCGGGWERYNVLCRQRISGSIDRTVPPGSCPSRKKPSDIVACNVHNCIGSWVVDKWTECEMAERNCGQGVRRPIVRCVNFGNGRPFSDVQCGPLPSNLQAQVCFGPPCDNLHETPRWRVASIWTDCDADCGRGHQTRNITCMHHNGVLGLPDRACTYHKPSSIRGCIGTNCSPNECRDTMGTLCAEAFKKGRCTSNYWSTQCCRTCGRLKTSPPLT